MGTSSERVFNGSGKGYLPAGTIGNRTHILSERLKAGTEFKRLKKGHRPAPMPPTWTHILSYKPHSIHDIQLRSVCDSIHKQALIPHAGQNPHHSKGVFKTQPHCGIAVVW